MIYYPFISNRIEFRAIFRLKRTQIKTQTKKKRTTIDMDRINYLSISINLHSIE